MKLIILSCFFIVLSFISEAQKDSLRINTHLKDQKDVIDVFFRYFPKLQKKGRDTLALENGKRFFWIIPSIGYTPQTDFLAQIYGNLAFKNNNANISTVISSLAVTENKQLLLTSMSSIWTPRNSFNIVGDYRLMQYPQDTYGLGIRSSTANDIQMDYAYLRIYQSILKNFGRNFYAGIGYCLDDHWNIEAIRNNATIEKISKYTYGISGRSVSSGISLNLLFDSRPNAINAHKGMYASVILRGNRQFLGSDNNYNAVSIDFRKYFPFRASPNKVLAIWSYNVLTFGGNPPFLDLPSTGWDTYSNVGRGYIQGRFRGKNLLYLEAEYRFSLSKNHLFGGVIFSNVQSVSQNFAKINSIMPAIGTGLRLKMNKLSRTNLAIDYGFGADGSSGLFFNIGEVF